MNYVFSAKTKKESSNGSISQSEDNSPETKLQEALTQDIGLSIIKEECEK